MKLLSVVGARPQFVKLGPMDRSIRSRHEHVILHTGQHYDRHMSDSFFDVLKIPTPDYNLNIGSASHGVQTGRMIAGIEEVILKEMPDCVLTYGDTNSTLAAALAAVKLHVPLAHIEAGLRSYNRMMPEEINRVLTDHASDMLFCPSKAAYDILVKEGLGTKAYVVGDLMVQLLLEIRDSVSANIDGLNLEPKGYILLTMHRQENVDDKEKMGRFIEFLEGVEETVVFPIHPRTRKCLQEFGILQRLEESTNIILIEPQDLLSFSVLEKDARLIMTDSGGVQKDAYVFGVPCITLREETEWTETVDEGWNRIVGTNVEAIKDALVDFTPPSTACIAYGGEGVSERILDIIEEHLR